MSCNCLDVVQDLPGVFKQQFMPMVAAEATIWTPVQYLNFTLLPVQHQQMFVNVISILEAAVLSWCALICPATKRIHSHGCETMPCEQSLYMPLLHLMSNSSLLCACRLAEQHTSEHTDKIPVEHPEAPRPTVTHPEGPHHVPLSQGNTIH